MMKTLLASGAVVCAFALSSLPSLAQTPPPGKPPMIGTSVAVDFGAGRQVRIGCGDTALADCIAAANPLIDKVASTPAPGPGPGGKGDHKGHKHKDDKDGPGKGGPDSAN